MMTEATIQKLKDSKLLIKGAIALADEYGKEYLMDKYNLTYEEISECYKEAERCPVHRVGDL